MRKLFLNKNVSKGYSYFCIYAFGLQRILIKKIIMKKKIFIGLVMLASTISNFTFAQDIYKTVANVPLVQLNNGILMPQLGLGTFLQPSDSVCEQSCLTALKAGYRHIDTAHAYNDEAGVGRAVKESGIPRKDIWITSKL